MTKFLNDVIIQGESSNSSIFHDANDIGTWKLSTKKFYVGSQEANGEAIFFKPDGTKMYILGRSGDDVNEYALSTAWDVTTASFTDTLAASNISGSPASEGSSMSMYMSPDGIYLYIVGDGQDQIIQYTLATAWDVSTASYTREQDLLMADGGDFANPTGLHFKADGTTFWVTSLTEDDIQQYNLSTAWDVSTISVGTNLNINPFFTLNPLENATENYGLGSIDDIAISEDGTKVWLHGSSYDTIHELTLSVAFNITTATYSGCTVRTTEYQGDAGGLYVNETEGKAFTVAPGGDFVRTYDFGGLLFSNSNQTSLGFKNGVHVFGDFVTSGGINHFQGRTMFSNPVNAYSNLTTYSTSSLTHGNGGTVNILDGTTHSTAGVLDVLTNVHWGRNNINQNPYTSGIIHNINLGRPRKGGIINLNIGRRQSGNTVSGDNQGVVNIVSKAQTFTHDGYLTIGQKLQVTGNADLQVFDLGGTVIFNDTFTESSTTDLASHTPDTGAGWTKVFDSGTAQAWNVTGGTGVAQASVTDSSDGMIYLCDTLPTTVDYEIKVDFLRRDSGDDTFSIIFKYKDADNFFVLQWSTSYSTYCRLRKKVAGTFTDITNFDYGVFNQTTDNLSSALKVRFIDNQVMVWDIDSSGYQAYRGSYIVSDFTNDGANGTFHKFGMGIGAIDGGSHDQTTTWKIDRFEVKQLSSAATLANSTKHYILNGNVGIGNVNPGASLHVSSITSDYVAKFSHTTATGYAPGSILLQAGQSTSRGQGLFHYNTEADDSWFTGVPYNVASTKWIVAHKADTTFNPDVAQTSHAILTIDSSDDSATFTGNVTLNTGTAKKLSILASTHDTNTAQTATLELGYGHSGGTGFGNIVLTEDANNSFGADMTFGLPHNNGSGGSSTRTALTLDGGTLAATFAGTVTANGTTLTGDQDLSGYAPLASPTFTGTPAAPTASAGTNTTQLATTSFVSTAVANIVDSAPELLNTLNELAAAIGDDENFSATVSTNIGTKVSKAGDTMTGQLLIKHDDGLGLKDTADASTSLTTLSSAPNGGNSKMLIKGGNFIHTVGFETSKNNFEYAELVSSYNGGDTQFKLYKSNSDTTATAATTTISTGASTFAGTISATNLSGTNTGDQTLPTASSLGAVTLTGTQTITGAKTFTSNSHRHSGHYYMTAYDAAGNHYPHFLDGSGNGGTTINWRQYYGSSLKTHTWVSDASGNMVFTYKGAIKAEGELEGTSLDINGNADISGTLITGSSATIESSLQVKRGGGASISLRREDTGIVEGELLGEIIFTGDDPSATNTGAAIKASAADTWEMASPNEYPSILEFQTAKLATPITALTLNEDQEATFTGNLFIPGNIIHVGDTNSYFGFHGNDLWRVVTGGSERLEVSSSGLKLGNTGATVTAILDQDNMSSNSATALATQQSIKAYVDANSGSGTVTGSGSSTRLAFWNSSSALTSDGDLTYATASNRLSSGSFLTPNNGDYLGTDTSGDRRTLITLDSNNDVEISNSALSSGSDTNIYFGDTFRIKDGGQTRLSIDSTGDITVGGIITSKIERLPNATTGLGTGSDSNYFSKLATFSITSGQSHDDIRIILDIVGEETSHSAYAKIGIMLRKGAATNTVPDVVDLHVLSMMNANDRDSLIDPDSFYLKYSAGAAHSVDLYVKKKNTYGMLKVFENSKNLEDWQVTYYTDSNWISALPASTYTLQSQHSSGVVMTTHAFQTTGSTAGFIPLKGTIVAQSAQYYSKFQPPSGGTLERITLKNTTNTSGVIVKVYGGTTAGSQLYSTNTLSLSANTPYSINPNVLITDTDSIAINVDPGSSNATRQWQVTCFYKF